MKFNAVKIITVVVTVQHGNMYMIMSSLPEAKLEWKTIMCMFLLQLWKNIHTKVDQKNIQSHNHNSITEVKI